MLPARFKLHLRPAFFSMLVVGLACALLAFLLQPLRLLVRAVKRVGVRAAGGDPSYGGDSRQLARAFDEMAAVLQAREAELRASEESTRLIIETAYEAFISIDNHGIVTAWNARAEEIFGWSRSEAIGQRLAELIIPVEQREAHERGMERFLATGEGPILNTRFEIAALHRDGHQFPVGLAVWPVRSGQQWSFNAVLEDISQRKWAEEALKKTLLDLERKTAELEAFTYSVSHDLKEPLRTLEAFSQFLLEDHADRLDEQGRDYLARMAVASARLKQMIDELLTLSHIGRRPEEPSRVSVAQVVANIDAAFQAAIAEKDARIEVEGTLPDVLADTVRVEQIFGNLIANGLKFNESDKPVLRIGVHRIEDGMVAFYVADNGIGIDPQYHDQIFGVFKRLHGRDEYDGTGAGLAIVARAVEGLGGRLSLDSSPGKGTTFFVSLPVWGQEGANELRQVAPAGRTP